MKIWQNAIIINQERKFGFWMLEPPSLMNEKNYGIIQKFASPDLMNIIF